VLGALHLRGAAMTAPTFVCQVARTDAERAGYFAVRRAIFCDEQRLFTGTDRDAVDAVAVPIVCVASAPGLPDRVVGVVRVWEEASGDFWGGRLGVDADFRTVGGIGKWLIQCAVGSARGWGAWRFRARVQRPNVPLFRRLHWQTREEIELLGQPHHLMEADLARYALTGEARPTFSAAAVATLSPSP